MWQQGTRLPVVCVPKLRRSVWSDTHRPALGAAGPQPLDPWGKPAGSPALLGGSDKVGENFLSQGDSPVSPASPSVGEVHSFTHSLLLHLLLCARCWEQ